MSTIKSQTDWKNIHKETLDSKYEKCRNITEEIYKRINITFQVKKLETSTQSDITDESDQIDSNDLSNETDLFACDKSSLSSSTELEHLELGSAACEKYININNNEETKVKKTPVVSKRPKKKFRKRIKKQVKNRQQSDGSSDEEPLVRDVDRRNASPHRYETNVPNIVIVTSDLNYKIKSQPSLRDKKTKIPDTRAKMTDSQSIDNSETSELSMKDRDKEDRVCEVCSFVCNGEKSMRRHMKLSHSKDQERVTSEQRNIL